MMNTSHIVRRVEKERWEQAREFELKFARDTIATGDDWNNWWLEQFDQYLFLQNKTFENVLEVGCGPHTNIRYILPLIQFKNLYLEDPLIQFYTTHYLGQKTTFWETVKNLVKNKPSYVNFLLKIFANSDVNVDLSSAMLENLPYRDGMMDLLVCINVLDHVKDYDLCMQEIDRVLKKGGILIIGQDLSNQEDLNNCPESYQDIGHPIKVDHFLIDDALSGKYIQVFKKILSRDEGRNPIAHYGTYLGIMQKI